MEPPARFGREPQFVRPTLRVGVIFKVLNRHFAACVRAGAVDRVVGAGDTLEGAAALGIVALAVGLARARTRPRERRRCPPS